MSEGKGSGFKDRSGKVHYGRGTPEKPAESRVSHAPKPAQDEGRKPHPRSDHRGAARKPGREHGRNERQGQNTDARRSPSTKSRAESVRLTGTVDKTKSGAGFLIFDRKEFEDLYIPPRDAEGLFHGDRVVIVADSRGQLLELKVLSHRFKELVGKFMPTTSPNRDHTKETTSGWLMYENRKFKEQVWLPEVPPTAKSGDYIRAKIHHMETGPNPLVGDVIEVFGPVIPASHDITMIAAEFNLTEEHSEAAVREAQAQKLEVPGKDLDNRTDHRGLPFITIDGETARDFDDAVYVQKENSQFILWVAIADVSNYVTDGTALDREAFERGTSVYFPERAFHMLPSALSENLCSLKPHEPRLAMTAKIQIDREGKFVMTELFDSVIESRRRATYNEIEKEREQNEGKNPKWEFASHFELYRILRKARTARGSIDFELPEFEIRVDDKGEPTTIQRRPRLDSHRLIEEFMIAANEAVTQWIMQHNFPFIYRVHDEPTKMALQKFSDLAKSVGFSIVTPQEGLEPKVFAEIVKSLEGHPAETLLNQSLLRSMKQAIYSSEYGKHFGLASLGYTHFTSPIRRYPDLMVHRTLRKCLWEQNKKIPRVSDEEKARIHKKLTEAAEHCSYRERLAAEAEREAIRLKQVRIMTKHLGEDFAGKVGGMSERGIFVQVLDPFVEGFVSKDVMDDDFYEYREEKMLFIGKRTKQVFRIGDQVQVQVIRADLDRRQIELKIIEHTPQTGEHLSTDFGESKSTARRREPKFERKHSGKPSKGRGRSQKKRR